MCRILWLYATDKDVLYFLKPNCWFRIFQCTLHQYSWHCVVLFSGNNINIIYGAAAGRLRIVTERQGNRKKKNWDEGFSCGNPRWTHWVLLVLANRSIHLISWIEGLKIFDPKLLIAKPVKHYRTIQPCETIWVITNTSD